MGDVSEIMSISQNQLFGALQFLRAALSANATDLPHLEMSRVRLDELVTEMQQVARLQASLTAQKQEATERLQTLMGEASSVASLLRKGVTVHYGTRSEKLAEFGLEPYRGRKFRRATPEPAEPEPAAE
jgi:hypothetical protein